jgi:drug/metabolite transporter (DMT)-like permease
MNRKLTLGTALLLTIPPLMWAGNAIVGRMVQGMVPPITLNFLRWAIAFVLLLPFAAPVLRAKSDLWIHWKRYTMLGLLGIGIYNALQYLALQTSTPINVTLVAASLPVWMLIIGALFFKAPISRRHILGSVLSIAGVLLVLSRGEWAHVMALRLVLGDIFIILATIAWSFYSWLLTDREGLGEIRHDWAGFLLAQVGFGLLWSGAFAGGEWMIMTPHILWSWPLAAALLYVGIGPAIVALRCWGIGVQRVGPGIAGFFNNLTPLFAALMSSAFLGERPHAYHLMAFILIVAGIWVSARRAPA